MTITEFLLARIGEDETVGRDWRHLALTGRDKVSIYGGGDGYIQLVNPARVLAECAAKRAIIATQSVSRIAAVPSPFILRALAAVHADHPDYLQEWAL